MRDKPLTILNVAYTMAPVGPDAVGGAEQILSRLDRALVEAGHCSIVVAPEGSQVCGELVATPVPDRPITEPVQRHAQARHRQAIETVLRRERVDLLHLHGMDFHACLPPPGVPALATLHLPPHWYPREVFGIQRPQTFMNCVSASQARACPAYPNMLGDIENGVPVDDVPIRAGRRFAITLGRICPEKNLHTALEAGRRARIPVLLGGQVFPYPRHVEYFETQIVPRLDRRRRFAGAVGQKRKRRLLAAARCLLVPSLAPETSSLVAMEAFACGTPVVVFPSGALPEIVEHGTTGFVVRDEREMADAIEAAGDLDPEACRHAARTRFSLQGMLDKYFNAYDWIVSQAQGPAV